MYHPQRLKVIARCRTVTGIVRRVIEEPDGDAHIDVEVDAAFARYINARNRAAQHGWLVVEIVPADRPGCTKGTPPKQTRDTYNYGICTGMNVPTPQEGDRISVTGPFFLDKRHGWNEIHPAWELKILA